MAHLGLIALGGALGALARHGLVVVGTRWVVAGMPLALLVVNVLGSFAAGALMTWSFQREGPATNLRAFLMVGFLGAFTTFSAFSWENLELVRSGQWGRAAAHAGLHVGLSIAAVAAGAAIVR